MRTIVLSRFVFSMLAAVAQIEFSVAQVNVSKPRGLSAESGFQQVTLTWNRNLEPDILKYYIYLDTVSSSLTKVDSSQDQLDTLKTITGLINGKLYFLRVTAIDSARRESLISDSVLAKPDTITKINFALGKSVVVKYARPTDTSFSFNNPARMIDGNPFAPSIFELMPGQVGAKIRIDSQKWRVISRITTRTYPPGNPTFRVIGYTIEIGRDTLSLKKVYQDLSNELAVTNDVFDPDTTRYVVLTIEKEVSTLRSTVFSELEVYGGYPLGTMMETFYPPSVPKSLTIQPGFRKATLRWLKNKERDLKKYYIYQGTSLHPTERVDSTSFGTDTSKTLMGFQPRTTYYFRVTAVDSSNNESTYSSNAVAPFGPFPPKSLSAEVGYGKVALRWSRNLEPGISKYYIYRGVTQQNLTKLDSATSRDDTIKTIRNNINGILYYFSIKAVDSLYTESEYSNVVEGKPLPFIPTNIFALAGYQEVTLIWNKNSEAGVTKYYVYKSTSADSLIKTDSTGNRLDTSRVINGLQNGINYFFGVTASDSESNESGFSVIVSAMPNKFPSTNLALFRKISVKYSDPRLISPNHSRPEAMVDGRVAVDSFFELLPHQEGTEIRVDLASPMLVNRLKIRGFPSNRLEFRIRGYRISLGRDTITYKVAKDVPTNELVNTDDYFPTDTAGYVLLTITTQDTSISTTIGELEVYGGFPVKVEETNNDIPKEFGLSQNYPNPFNPRTNFEVRVANSSFVSLKIFDVLGRAVATLMNEQRPAGEYLVIWDASSLPSGVYFSRMQAGSFVETKKIVLMK